MEQKLQRKYGLFTAICMVVGIVIGSGVFFKAQTILSKTGGDMPLGVGDGQRGLLILQNAQGLHHAEGRHGFLIPEHIGGHHGHGAELVHTLHADAVAGLYHFVILARAAHVAEYSSDVLQSSDLPLK